jgi:putative FmdB family regulatory protein
MPLYDFRCPACGLMFEVSRSFSQAGKEANCPVDGSVAERVYTAPMTTRRGSVLSNGMVDLPPAPPSGHGHGHSHGPGGHTH